MLPPCPDPITESFDPVLEPELRFDATTATFTGGPTNDVVDGVRVWTGGGISSTPLWLNRGFSYTVTGKFNADAATTISLVQTLGSGLSQTVATWSVEAGGTLELDENLDITQAGAFTFNLNLQDEGHAQLSMQIMGEQWADDPAAVAAAPLSLGFLMHIEDSGQLSSDEVDWNRRAAVVEALSKVLQAHGASLTLQPGESFIAGELVFNPEWLAAREAEGMTWSVHVHNEADGVEALERSVRNSAQNYRDADIQVRDLNGGFQLGVWSDLYNAGMRSLTAYKNPETQLDLLHPHVQPWRPADGTNSLDEDAFTVHDPDGPLIFLPGSGVREADHARYGEFIRRHLAQVRSHTKAGYVNTWYFIEHVDGFGPDAQTDDFDDYLVDGRLDADMALIDAGLTDVVDPLVAAGEVVPGNPDVMREDFRDWESRCSGE